MFRYCNNEDVFGYTDGTPTPGGFLSNLDSQQLLTFDNQTVQGAYNDNDMLEVSRRLDVLPSASVLTERRPLEAHKARTRIL